MGRLEYLPNGVYRSGEKVVLSWPYLTLSAATAKRAVVFKNGYGSDATSIFPSNSPPTDPVQESNIPELLGPFMACPDLGVKSGVAQINGGASFGNDDSIAATTAAVNWVQTLPGVKTDKVVLLGISMGGIVLLNWARQNPTRVAAIALMIPLLDLQYLHDTAPTQSQNGVTFVSQFPNVKADVESSWGGGAAPPSGYYNTHSPIVYASQLAGIPMTLWVSNNDAVTNSPAAPSAFVSAVGPSAAIVNCGAQPGLGHASPCATLPAIASFLQGYL